MPEDEDDYLSDKFLVDSAASSSAPKSYAELRKEAARQAKLKNEQNRLKSRRQREVEAREEGLRKSLFERSREEEDAGIISGNKALSMMMKMGFKPGQALGRLDDSAPDPPTVDQAATPQDMPPDEAPSPPPAPLDKPAPAPRHTVEPLPINEWAGKKGIGLAKRPRAPSPTSEERVAKMAKMAEEATHSGFRDRARQEYEERRAEGRLAPAQRTCVTLDEKAGKSFNVLWLNPRDVESFPPGLADAITLHATVPVALAHPEKGPLEDRLRVQMQADALTPLSKDDTGLLAAKESLVLDQEFPPDVIAEAIQFLRLSAQDRLRLLLGYLRDKYAYCFWCGTQYDDEDDLRDHCPGPDEEAHD